MTRPATLRVLIADDEPLARALLRRMLAEHDDVVVVGEAAEGEAALALVRTERPDVLFLDVQMPRLTGPALIRALDAPAPAVVFVTAFDAYAVEAFELRAVDYLLKPFERDRLVEALARARERLQQRQPAAAAALKAAGESRPRPLDRILIRDGAKVHIVPVSRVDYVQAQDDYVCIRSEGREYLKEQTLGELEAALDPARFVRIHRSYLLNVDRLARVEPMSKDSRAAILKDGTELPVSRAGYQRLTELLG